MVILSTATIVYCAYMFYLFYAFILLVDWDYILNNEQAIWIAVITLFTLLIITCLFLTFTEYNRTILIIILCTTLIAIGIVLFYQYNMIAQIPDDIISKINSKGLIPLIYQYGRDSDEIAIRLGVSDIAGISRGETKTLQEIWQTLMSDRTHRNIKVLFGSVLYSDFDGDIDIMYDLMWKLSISDEPFRNYLNNREIRYVISANIHQLRSLLGNQYDGADDRSSLIFTILSGQIIPKSNIDNAVRYDQIKQYNSNIVYNLSFIHNKIIDHDNGTYNPYGPYTYLSMQSLSPIEDIMASVDMEGIDDLIARLGIGPIHNISTMTDQDKILYIQGELSLYHNVFTRESGMEQPPNLNGKTRDEIFNILSRYTNIELIEEYEPRGIWRSRTDLFNLIYIDAIGGAKWSIHSLLHCNNDDTINIITGDIHADVDKNDDDDPTLSYGIQKNYRCFQTSELEASFREYDGVFIFKVPDWTQGSIDPITQAPLQKEFNVQSIKQLQELLVSVQSNITTLHPMRQDPIDIISHSSNVNITNLINKINYGLQTLKSADMQTRTTKQRFQNFTLRQKQIVELYLGWMFMYGMWMRFWKGPGYQWPMIKINVNRVAERNRAERSSPQERDEHIFIQEGVRALIIEMYENDIVLKDWIESLATIYYNFETREASCATHNIKGILDQIALGDYCMGFGSDTILKTSYYYIIALLDHPSGPPFDEFMRRILPQILDLEYTVISNQLNLNISEGPRLEVLRNRMRELNNPIPKLLTFNPNNYQNNFHVD